MEIDITDYIEHEVSIEQKKLAYRRTILQFGGVDFGVENDDFREEFDQQLRMIAAKQIIEDMESDDLLKVVGIDHGEYRYA